ncbi:MAG: PSD1 and planctomycete cytochrome C domain-containing protein, partial [Planctomycetaceae bacterium]
LVRLPVFTLSVVVAAVAGISGFADEPKPDAAIDEAPATDAFFTRRVLPILKERCYKCHSHSANTTKGGLVLDSRTGWITGGDSGPAIVPGKADESVLIQAVRYSDLKMPPTGKLASSEIAILERWVAAGAVDPRQDDAVNSGSPADLETRARHWAFQPVHPMNPPRTHDESWPLTGVDRFLLAALEEHSLRPVPEADRYTWLRRVSFDLTGLPPTPSEMADFVGDPSALAWERVVDRLLASPAFGQRWARHWLDLVGYADQIGTSNNVFAEHAWRYRDYTIESFNADKPYDRFLREQIAGDVLPHHSIDERTANLAATGFLLLGDLSIVEADKAKLRVDTVDQQVDKIGRAMLGMTLGCARCHDHKFDPISQRDYYAVAGILNGTDSVGRAPWGVWSFPTTIELPETAAGRTQREEKSKQHQERIDALRTEQQRAQNRNAEIEAMLKKNDAPAAGSPARVALEHEQKDLNGRLPRLDAEIIHAEFFTPAIPLVFAVRDLPDAQDMHVTIRGNPHALGDSVPRGFPAFILPKRTEPIPTNQSGRLQLADWITSPENPLTPRVAVNRIWQKLFGEGIVRSVDYFGLRGEVPSHPELLDYLATKFMAEGWSQKRLIRELVLSRAYRMSSHHNPAAYAADGGNRWLWHMQRRRLDAEALRDAMLAVSGRLVSSSGGSALPLEFVENTGGLKKGEVNPPSFNLGRFRPEQEFQRTVYLPIIRSAPQAGPAEVRNVFDFTQPAEISGRRATTTVPTQALFLMNSRMLKSRARDLAERTLAGSQAESDQLATLWLAAINRPITADEQAESSTFLAALRQQLSHESQEPPDELERRAWSELCHALLASNEFLILQ